MELTSGKFFETVYEGVQGNIEFRFLSPKPGEAPNRMFWPVATLPGLPPFPPGRNCYFAPNSRNGGGTKEHIEEIPSLFCDIDFKDTPREQADANLKRCPCPPSILNDSGGGYHVFFLLKKSASKNDIPLVESLQRRLALYLGGDSASTEAAHILRVPGTKNFKYDPPRIVRTVLFEPSRKYDFSDFDSWLPEDPKKQTSNGEARNPKGWQNELIKGVNQGSRHKAALSLAGRYFARGLETPEVLQIMLAWNCQNSPPLPGRDIEKLVADVWKMHDKKHPKQESPLEFPSQVMGGLAGYFAELYSEHLEVPPHFFYMAFLTCLGSVLADKLTLASEIRPQPRMFTILLGESADDRKSTALSKTVDFFKDTVEGFSTCWGIGSAEGLQKQLTKSKRLLLCFDELKQFVSKSKIEASVLLPCVNTLFESNRYESRTKKTDIYFEDAYLSFLAASTVQTYERMWDAGFTDIGFTNRLFLVPGRGERKFSFPSKLPEAERRNLKQYLGEILAHVGEGLELDLTPEARDLFQSWYMGLERSVHSKRLDTYALRLMSILAVNDKLREIDEVTVQKAITLCDWQLEVRRQHDPIDADNMTARMEESIRRILKLGPQTERDLRKRAHVERTGLWFFERARSNLQRAREIVWNKELRKWEGVNEN